MIVYKSHKVFALKLLSCFIMIVALCTSQDSIMASAKRVVADTIPPTVPQNFMSTWITPTSISLKWSSSVDNRGVASYLIYKNAAYFATTTGTSYTVTGLTAATTYSFYIKAKDTSGNTSFSSRVISATTAAAPAVPAKIISGYYGSWAAYSGYTPLSIPASKLTNINYAFANIGSDFKIALGDPDIDIINFNQMNQLKKTYPNIKTLISVGGWEWSDKFSDVALTDSSRTVFADSAVAFIRQYGFDGVDIDWEDPAGGGLSTNVKRPEDKTNFTLLLQKLSEKLNAQGLIDGKKYLLSIAGSAGDYFASNVQLSLIANYIDYANVMTYDIHGSWDTYTDLNAPLYTPTETSPQYKWSVDAAVKAWTSKGFPASKIVIGVPFYGYMYNGVSGGNGLYKTFTNGSSITYDKIASNYLTNSSFVQCTHPDAKVPWLFNGSVFVSYDNEPSIAEKAKYASLNDLGGVSIWELSQNRSGVLLDALYANLK